MTAVSWPGQVTVGGKSEEATTGRRFVEFTLKLAESAAAASPQGGLPALTAALRWDNVSHPISLAKLTATLTQDGGTAPWPSASGTFVASVPNTAHRC